MLGTRVQISFQKRWCESLENLLAKKLLDFLLRRTRLCYERSQGGQKRAFAPFPLLENGHPDLFRDLLVCNKEIIIILFWIMFSLFSWIY